MWRITYAVRFMAETAGGWARFLVIVGGVAVVLGWLAWAVYVNGGTFCGPIGGSCHHGKVTP